MDGFTIESPKDTGDDRVTFIIKSNGTVIPGFISKATLIAIGGETSNNLVSLFNANYAKIFQAVSNKMPAPMKQYISISTDDLQ
ncbi:hypothetical protein [Herbaspirillum autotrophicum]|uniref:hypothetical protein n=1 Tax=Herbaspirillum autotrophicum TaxID=180195 RepID=UPI00067D6395|nr:hypothetical protein [Herbaspirillum autotrophicum]